MYLVLQRVEILSQYSEEGGQRETMKNFRQNSRCCGGESNWRSLGYEAGIPVTTRRRSTFDMGCSVTFKRLLTFYQHLLPWKHNDPYQITVIKQLL
jgi:hypothetical protein